MNKFEELASLDVGKYIEKKSTGRMELSYLTWSYAWREFNKVYPGATYKIKPYLYDQNLGYMVFTEVTADGLTREMWLPVMDGANRAMKAEPYTIYNKQVPGATMMDINKAYMRCLVKNLAMFGLGLYIYAGEDLPEDIRTFTCDECGEIFKPAINKKGEYLTPEQVYHMAILAGEKSGLTDGKARCPKCLKKIREGKDNDGKETV